MSDTDIWSFTHAPEHIASAAKALILQHDISDIDAQYRDTPSDKPWVAPELQELLFSRYQRTFLIVDATLRTNITGSFDLDAVAVPIRSFFTGVAAEKYKSVAPYLVDMTLPAEAWDDPDAVPDFHLDFFKRHWQHGTGIIIRTPATMDEVWSNFRKFTKVKMSNGKVTYFRFWDVGMLMYFLDASTDDELDRFFVTPEDVFYVGRPSKLSGNVQVQSASRKVAG